MHENSMCIVLFYIYWRTFPLYNKITEKQMNSLNEVDYEFERASPIGC